MAIDFTRYQTPGIYTEDVGAPQLSVFSTVPTAVAIFGQVVGYRTYRESIKINPDTGATVTTQVISLVGGPTSFTLTLSGQTTGSIPANSTPGTVQTALRSLSNVGDDGNAGGVTVAGTTGGPWTATFYGAFSELSGTTTGGTSASVGVDSTQAGVAAMNKTLAQKGIKTDTIKVVDPNAGTTFEVGTDYVITRVSVGEDSVQNTRDDQYTIQRVIDGGHIDAGDTVQLSYQYTDPTYFEVFTFYDYDDVVDQYGTPFDAAGNIQSELTLAARFAFINGASTILACAVDPADPDTVTIGDYADALDKFLDEPQIAIIVPATGATAIQALVQQHVTVQSGNRYERRAVIGMDGSVTPVLSSTRIANAQSLTERRIALISPSAFQYFAPELNTTITLGGQYMAAAVAGKSVSAIAAMPLTRKVIRGFSDVTENMREGMKTLESSQGLMVVEKTARNQIQIRHGVTTDPTDLHTREWSIIGQQDVMVYRIRDYLDADGLIGMPIYDTTITQVKASAESALVNLVDNAIIRGYQNLKARQISDEPDVIEVRFEWRPAYPLNYIVVRYSIAVESGDISVTTTGTTNPQ